MDELPRDPHQACSGLTSVIAVCKLKGAGPDCCSQLDAMLADRKSPAAGCLCYPMVLYTAVTRAARSNVDLLGLLQQCANQGSRCDWASKQDTTCPKLALNATVLDLGLLRGDAEIIEGHKGSQRQHWEWLNLLQAGDAPTEFKGVMLAAQAMRTFKWMLAAQICIAPLFLAIHRLLQATSRVYRSLAPVQQLVSTQHAMCALVFGLSLVPQTALAFRFLWRAWTGHILDSWLDMPMLIAFILLRGLLYLVEASVRSIHFSWLLLIHHTIFFLIVVLFIWTESLPLLAVGVVLDLGACHEAPLYVVLLGYRLAWSPTATQRVLLGACTWYLLTRVVQTIMLAYMFIGWFADSPSVRSQAGVIIVGLLVLVLTVIQAFTLVIYRGISRKLDEQIEAAGGRGVAAAAAALAARLGARRAAVAAKLGGGSAAVAAKLGLGRQHVVVRGPGGTSDSEEGHVGVDVQQDGS